MCNNSVKNPSNLHWSLDNTAEFFRFAIMFLAYNSLSLIKTSRIPQQSTVYWEKFYSIVNWGVKFFCNFFRNLQIYLPELTQPYFYITFSVTNITVKSSSSLTVISRLWSKFLPDIKFPVKLQIIISIPWLLLYLFLLIKIFKTV